MTFTVQPKLNLSDDLERGYNGWADYTTWNCALWINNEPTIYNLAAECKDYTEFLYEMQVMCGFSETPDGADYGEADYDEMNEVIQEITEPVDW
jgi:hypothetical protein